MNFSSFIDVIDRNRREAEQRESTQKLIIGMTVAALAGLFVGIAFAPKSGKETREDLRELISTEYETVKENAALASDEMSKIIKNIKSRAEEITANIKDNVDESKEDIKEAVEKI